MSNAPYTQLDSTQVIRQVFDESQDRLRVDAAISLDTGQLDIVLTHEDDSIRLGNGTDFLTTTSNAGKIALDVNLINDPLAISIDQADDSIRIGDGTNLVTTTTVTSKIGLDVNIISTSGTPTNTKIIPNGETVSTYNEISSVSSGVLSTIATYIVPMGVIAYLCRTEYMGTNIATYTLFLNGTIIDKKITYFSGSMDTQSEFDISISVGLPLVPGDIIEAKVIHNRPDPGDFTSRILAMEI